MRISYYSYNELRAAATANPTFENLDNLARWFDIYGMRYWNGESYGMDDGLRLYPIYGDEDEDGDFPIIDYEIR